MEERKTKGGKTEREGSREGKDYRTKGVFTGKTRKKKKSLDERKGRKTEWSGKSVNRGRTYCKS